ncbi:MAG TPA: TIGR01777 family protein, partial [Flammeovirgaceae bacterium]|nr:TIGR01777 family protein [Flammeovirgaceae bacterium]
MCYVLANLVCFVQIMTNVLITGGSGLIGRLLTTMLQEQGYRVGWFSRQAAATDSVRVFHWQPAAGQLDDAALEWADSLIHLAGETVAQRWTKSARQRILHSRLQSTRLLADRLAARGKRLQSVICASAIGYYGHQPQEMLTEESPPGQGFLAEVTTAWEAATNRLASAADHLAKVRIGVVLTTAGGALPRMIAPVKWGLGAPLGTGRQWMSWITIDDLCRLFVFILQKGLTGVYNGVAPTAV